MSWSSRRGASAATRSRPTVRTWGGWRRSIVLAACSGGAGSTAHAGQPRRAAAAVLAEAAAGSVAGKADHGHNHRAGLLLRVRPGSPAARHGLRPGDIIVSVDGAPPFPGGIISDGVMNLLFGPYPAPGRVTVQLHRPATGRTWTVALTSGLYQAAPPPVSTKLLHGDIGYVLLPGFFSGSADQVLQAVHGVAGSGKLRGLVLDLRGNGGGDSAEVSRLLGAFIHGAVYAYDCDVHGNCPATYTGTDVPLLHLPLVVLTDRNCASGCDAFSGAVKDLRLGTLVGTRTAGIVAAPAAPHLLDDASVIFLPVRQELSARHELINGIGVAPDYYLPLTAHDLSTGHDPDIAKALTLLSGP